MSETEATLEQRALAEAEERWPIPHGGSWARGIVPASKRAAFVAGAVWANANGLAVERERLMAEVAERIAQAIESAGREDVGWLAQHQDDRIDSARIVGAEDAWKSAVRIAREAGRA